MTQNAIAVIGMAGRFPGASDVHELWSNLVGGRESIRTLTDEELNAAGLPSEVYRDPMYVRARGILDGVGLFDAPFFHYNPREAEIIDPQQRILLELGWSALEDSGYDSARYKGQIGVFAGVAQNTYLLFHLLTGEADLYRIHSLSISSDKDFAATRVSYKLDLRGPSVTIQSACSTSLVAIHLACQSLLAMESDIALAGGASIFFPQVGYMYEDGGVFSRDGHCRAFDRDATGTIGGDGAGVVVLKRLEDAVQDHDYIYAVIRGSAVNNDGATKASFAAPSVDGQARAIAEALAVAGVDPRTVAYVETHGTGTSLGDPVEIRALTRVYEAAGVSRGSCSIGSIKPNIGHLDQAAGVASFIKAVLILQRGQIPPSLHFDVANPAISLESTPFRVNSQLADFPSRAGPRRVGVSSFGFGGTNAHVVLEEAPIACSLEGGRPTQLVVLSARTGTALEKVTDAISRSLAELPSGDFGDLAYVLQTGRTVFRHRRFVVARNSFDAHAALVSRDPMRVFDRVANLGSGPLYFLFPGQGSQYSEMGKGLYETERVFREAVDRCATTLMSALGVDIRELLFTSAGGTNRHGEFLSQTQFAQPALFTIEYAVALLWQSWGISPSGMIGHSIGEYIAACLAGVFELDCALTLVAARGRLMQTLPPGIMLAVFAPPAAVEGLASSGASVAAVNSFSESVLSGEPDEIAKAEVRAREHGFEYRRLQTSHAFHSPMTESILEPFRHEVSLVPLRSPRIPFISNLTGTWIEVAQACDPDYWVRHLRSPVMFEKGVATLLAAGSATFIEIGPGSGLCQLVRQHPSYGARHEVIASMRREGTQESDESFAMSALGRAWARGVDINWFGFHADAPRRRIPLPTYPFEQQEYLVPPRTYGTTDNGSTWAPLQRQPSDRWLYLPSWRRAMPPTPATPSSGQSKPCLLLLDSRGVLKEVGLRLRSNGRQIWFAQRGSAFRVLPDGCYAFDPDQAADYDELTKVIEGPVQIINGFAFGDTAMGRDEKWVEELVLLVAALKRRTAITSVEIVLVASGTQDVGGTEPLDPARAALFAACRAIPHEFSSYTCRQIDLLPNEPMSVLIRQLMSELDAEEQCPLVAYRGAYRFEPSYQRIQIAALPNQGKSFKRDGVYMLIGGLGAVGMEISEYLASKYDAKLVLVSRTPMPRQTEWDNWLSTHRDTDNCSQRIRALRHLAALGTEMEIVAADVANEGDMLRIVALTRERFGALHGVFHLAGVTGDHAFRGITDTTPEFLSEHFRAKARGTLALGRILREVSELEFVVLQSTLYTILGGAGTLALSAAGAFVDSFAELQSRNHNALWVAVDWDAWRPRVVDGRRADLSMPANEALETLTRVLALGIPRVIVSTVDLNSRIHQWTTPIEPDRHVQNLSKINCHDRPAMATEYIAPRTELESTLATIWQEVLGLKEVGIEDDFFDLGGHSLMATQVIGRIHTRFPVAIDIHELIEARSISRMAEILEDRLLAKLEAMSDDEADLLAAYDREGE